MTREPAEDWRSRAACLGDPEGWFPIGTSTRDREQAKDAKATCRRCPVRDACLTWALDTHQAHGIWGGLSEDERATITRRAERDATKARKAART